jgi:hypothetical protein
LEAGEGLHVVVDDVAEFVEGVVGGLVDSVLEDIVIEMAGRLCAKCVSRRMCLIFWSTITEGQLDVWWCLCCFLVFAVIMIFFEGPIEGLCGRNE